MPSALEIELEDFQNALQRYPEVIKKHHSKPPKAGFPTIEELDNFRYVEAPSRFSKGSTNAMQRDDVMKLVDWKLRHGVFRASLPKQVASNTDELIRQTLTDAFALYEQSPSKPSAVIKKLAGPLRGVGPATASLLLSVYDPTKVVFFSDEAYRWLCASGNPKAEIKYNFKEIDQLFEKSKDLMDRLQVTALDIEKVAYVLMKEAESAISNQTAAEAATKTGASDEIPVTDHSTNIIGELLEDFKDTIETTIAQASGALEATIDTEDDLLSPGDTPVPLEATVTEDDALMSPATDEEITQQVAADLSHVERDSSAKSLKRKAEGETSQSPAKKRGRPSKPKSDNETPVGTPGKRGRPRKSNLGIENESGTPTASRSGTVRKVGRPPNPEARKSGRPAVVSGRKRGRPSKPKTESESKTPVVKRPRGRPPKVASTDANKSSAKGEKKGRGRPRKITATDANKLEVKSEKKPRGRPPKSKEGTSTQVAGSSPSKRGRPRKV